MASERGIAQTVGSNSNGVVGLSQGVAREITKPGCNRRLLERTTKEGDSPVREMGGASWKQFPSTAGHVKSRGKLGGPSSKAKY